MPLFLLSKNAAYIENNDVKLNDIVKFTANTMIKANGKLFKLLTIITNFAETFPFGKSCLIVQIQIIENCKTKIFI